MKTTRLSFLLALICLSNPNLTGQAIPDQISGERHFGQVPLIFEPNRGQARRGVEFLARATGYTVLLEADKTEVLLPMARTGEDQKDALPSTVAIEFVGASHHSHYKVAERLPGKSNYFVGKQSSRWMVGIPQYGRISQKSVYPGIDLVYYGNAGNFEYDFVLAPGADPQSLILRVQGADNISINDLGDLVFQTVAGAIRLQKPAIYQEKKGTRSNIEGKFVLRGSNQVGIAVGDYDADVPLVVDPVLSFSTLIGANNNTQSMGVAVDSASNVYITGTTFATNYPTVNAFQSTNRGTTNVFITKLNPGGNKILYSTYLGSSGFDNDAAIAVDGSGDAYLTGTVGAGDFPTTPGAFMTSCPSICNTPFVAKLLSDGTLAFSTFMGGSNSPAHAITVDSAGEAYIAGDTASNDLPTTPGSFEPNYPGMICTSCYNGYVEKLNAAGTALVYSTYFGTVPGNGFPPSTAASGIAVDSAGSAYIVGNTTAIPLRNPLQSSVVGGPNAFVAKFSPDGSSLAFSTYLGGGSAYFFSYAGDFATGVVVDSSDNIHVVGTTSSCEFPLMLAALSTDCVATGYEQKVFVVTLNSTGNQILFSTLLRSGFSSGIGVDSKGNTYVTGTTTSNNYFVKNAIENNAQDASNIGFITELDLTGKLVFSTYLGATSGGSTPAGIAVDGKGGIYVTGGGQGDFPLLHPIPTQTFQSTYYTLFLSKISPSNIPQFTLSPRVSPILALRNVSSVPLTISSIVPSSNFTMEGNCGASIAPGDGCELILLGASDKKTVGSVTITSNASALPQKFVIHKSPTGDSLAYSLSIYPIYIQFPPQLIGTTSAPQQFVIRNLGLPAAINSISIIQPAAFAETNDCPAQLSTGAFCTVSVTYTAATAQDSAQLEIISDPNQTRNTVFLSGSGSTTAIAMSTPSVEFGNQPVGAPALGRIVNLTNATPDPATITLLSVSPGFAETDTCSAALPARGECRVSINFTASGNQDAPGTLTISNYGPGGPEIVNLHATGIQPGDLGFSPTSLNFPFGYIGIGANNSPVTLTNKSTRLMTIQGISNTGPFTQTNTCPAGLSAGATCEISVVFQPTVIGPATGTLQVVFAGSGSPQTMPLSGTGVTVVQFNPSPVDFGQQVVSTSGATSVGLDNFGVTTVTLGAVTVSGSEFKITSKTCGSSLARNTGCSVNLLFTPSGTGLRTGTISVKGSDYSQAHTATLQGTGISTGAGTLSASNVTFGSQKVGTKSAAKTISLTNTGIGTLTINSITVSPQFFTKTTTCSGSLLAGAKCTISVFFDPTLQGILAGSLSIQDDGTNGLHTVSLTGTGQ